MAVDTAALVAGSIRFASGVHFLADPLGANRLWGDKGEVDNTARLLLRSMGYRDFLIGLMLVQAAVRGKDTRAAGSSPRVGRTPPTCWAGCPCITR